MQKLDENGNITEPCSRRWGKKPLRNEQRRKMLLWRRWIWLLIPIAGITLYVMDSEELTNSYGYTPWWL